MAVFLLLLNLVVLSRVGTRGRRFGASDITRFAVAVVVPFIAALALLNLDLPSMLTLLGILMGVPLGTLLAVRRWSRAVPLAQAIGLVVLFILIDIWCAAFAPTFRPAVLDAWADLPTRSAVLAAALPSASSAALARTLGVLLCWYEMGPLVGHALDRLRLQPDPNDHVLRSPLIGQVERLFVFTFTVANQFNAVAFILTAKGIVRLGEMKGRETAEYVLIGTLLSTACAIAIGLALRGVP